MQQTDLLQIKPGRYPEMTFEQYHHQTAGWSKSMLDWVTQSMAHYFAHQNDESTESQVFGQAFHSRVLTPDLYQKEYAAAPKCDRRTNVGKDTWARFQNNNLGKLIISESDALTIEEMSKAIAAHPVAAELLGDGKPENSFFWIDPTTELLCKCRPDSVVETDGIIIDLKSTSDASRDAFQKQSISNRYHVQGAFFLDGVNTVIGTQSCTFILIAVEKASPYGVAVYELDSISLAVGREKYAKDLRRVKEYNESEEKWAGYPTQIETLTMPQWARVA